MDIQGIRKADIPGLWLVFSNRSPQAISHQYPEVVVTRLHWISSHMIPR